MKGAITSNWLNVRAHSMQASLKPGSYLCDKHNTSGISISISTRKKDHVPFFLCLCLCRLCYAYRTSACEPGLSFILLNEACSAHKTILTIEIGSPISLLFLRCPLALSKLL